MIKRLCHIQCLSVKCNSLPSQRQFSIPRVPGVRYLRKMRRSFRLLPLTSLTTNTANISSRMVCWNHVKIQRSQQSSDHLHQRNNQESDTTPKTMYSILHLIHSTFGITQAIAGTTEDIATVWLLQHGTMLRDKSTTSI